MEHLTLHLSEKVRGESYAIDGSAVEVCRVHDDTVVFYDGDLRRGCPLCRAEATLDDNAGEVARMKDEVDLCYERITDLEALVDGYRDEVTDLSAMIDELEDGLEDKLDA